VSGMLRGNSGHGSGDGIDGVNSDAHDCLLIDMQGFRKREAQGNLVKIDQERHGVRG